MAKKGKGGFWQNKNVIFFLSTGSSSPLLMKTFFILISEFPHADFLHESTEELFGLNLFLDLHSWVKLSDATKLSRPSEAHFIFI